MKGSLLNLVVLLAIFGKLSAQAEQASNPIVFADVPDMSIVRVDDTYYMSSTTMHVSPGMPIMSSKDLRDWKSISYAYL